MVLVSPSQSNPNDEITASSVNNPVNAIAAVVNGQIDGTNISSLSGAKISTGTLPLSALDTASSINTRLSEGFFDFVASGCVWSGDSYGSTRNASMTAGVVYISGKRITVAAVTARTFTASKDTYIDVDSNGTVGYTEVANNAASPALAAGSIRIGIIVTGASNIAAVGSVNQGQDEKLLPITSGFQYAITDSLGNRICRRSSTENRLGLYKKTSLTTLLTTSYVTQAQVTAISTGESVEAQFSLQVRDGGSGSARTGQIRVQCDGVTISDNLIFQTLASDARAPLTYLASSTPAAGVHVWTLQVLAVTASATYLDQAYLRIGRA